MQKPLHLRAIANVDKTRVTRKSELSEEFSLSHEASTELELTYLEHDDREKIEFVQSLYQKILSECRFASQENLASIPHFKRNEVIEGLTLGKGGFGTISAVKGFSLNSKEDRQDVNITSSHFDFEESVKDGEVESKKFMARHCFRNNGGARYALKRLQRKTVDDDLDCLKGMTDLVNETLFLGSINHPYVIKLRGIAMKEMCSKDFFIIIDRLYDTLSSRLVKWKAEEKKISGLRRIFRERDSLQRKDLLATRLNNASQLVSALTYLHRHRIIHRDLKPENIGFDVRGDINIFDFGLARELPRKPKGSPDTTFNLTKAAGTPRYMAPEVSSGKYNEACDIYSAGLLLWEFITLKRPFKDQKSLEDFGQNVWSPNGAQCRPKVPKNVSPGLQRLLTRSWAHNIIERPSAMQFENAIRFEITNFRDDWSDEETKSEFHPALSLTRQGSSLRRLFKYVGRSNSSLRE